MVWGRRRVLDTSRTCPEACGEIEGTRPAGVVRQVVSVDGVGPGFSEPEFLLDARLRCCEVETTSGKELKHGLLVAELAFFTDVLPVNDRKRNDIASSEDSR